MKFWQAESIRFKKGRLYCNRRDEAEHRKARKTPIAHYVISYSKSKTADADVLRYRCRQGNQSRDWITKN